MSSRTLNQDKALAWYCREKNLSPQLSAHPVYFFTHKNTGRQVEVNIISIVSAWEQMRKAEVEERSRVRRARA